MRHGFERYCKDYENIENYQKALADNFIGWDCHHRLETHNSDGERRLVDITRDELKSLGMYYNRPSSELIFIKHNEHKSLHKPSEETKKKMSTAKKGEKHPMYGKHRTEETRKKIAETNKGKKRSEETRKKIAEIKKGNTNTKGRRWFNNGKINKVCYECPEGFIPGMLFTNKIGGKF